MTTQTTAKHTPLEWFAVGSPDDTSIDGTAEIRSDDATVAHVFGTIDGSPKGNAAFIVQAVNNHYALVEALRIMVDIFNVEAIDPLKAFIAIERGRAALALAEKGKQ